MTKRATEFSYREGFTIEPSVSITPPLTTGNNSDQFSQGQTVI